MNTQSIPVVAMASISFYVGFYHLFIYFRRRQNREDLTFAFLCFTIVFYDAFCVGLYNATTVSEGAQWQRAQFISLAIFVPAFLWFVSDYTHQKVGVVVYGYSIFYLLAAILQLVDRSDLTFLVDQPSIKQIVLPHIQPITYYEATLGPFSVVQGLIGLFASAYVLILGIRYFRRGHQREATPLILATGLMYAAGLHDTLVSNGVYDFIYLIEYTYLATILMMAYSLSNTVVEAAIAKEELRKQEEWFRSLVETTSDWVWEVDANGVYTYASPKVRDLLGYEPEEILGRTPFDLMPPGEASNINSEFREFILSQGAFEKIENTNLHKDGRLVVLETSGVPFFDEKGKLLGYRGIDRDITERKYAEAHIERTLRETRVRFEVSQALAGTETEDEVLDVLIQHAGLYPEAFVALVTFDRTGDEVVAVERRADPFESGVVSPVPVGTRFPSSRFPMLRLLSTDRPFVSHDVASDDRIDLPIREGILQMKTASLAAFSLVAGNEWLGYIAAFAKPAGYFDEEKQHLYQTLAEQGAVALRAARLRETIRESGERLRAVFEGVSEGIVVTNLQGAILDCNEATVSLFGCDSRDELLGLNTLKMTVKDEQAQVRESVRKMLETGYSERSAEYKLLRKDGSVFDAELSVASLRDGEGKPTGFVVGIHDITARKRAEVERENLISQLEVKNAESETLRESLASLVGTFEFGEIIQRILDQIRRVVPYDSASIWSFDGKVQKFIGGRNLPAMFLKSNVELTVDESNSALPILKGEVPYLLNNNVQEELTDFQDPPHNIINSWLAIPLKTRGNVLGLICLDGYSRGQFTERHAELAVTFANQVAIALENAQLVAELQKELAMREDLIDELSAKNAELERFTYTVSHDLKSPLVTINGFLGYLEEDIASGNMERFKVDIKRIQDAVNKMHVLLNELLELSRIGRLMNPPEEVAFAEIVREALENVEGQLQNRGIAFTLQPDLPTVYGDRQRLVEVLQNLLDNATKFMGEQSDPRIEIGQSGDENGKPVFFVRDNGIGIAPEHHERIFSLFDKLNPRTEGTGIGLAIVKRIIEVHGGRIWVESEAGMGSTFYFTLERGKPGNM